MKKNGFTLVELIATITLIAAISLLVFPTMLKQFKNKKQDINEVTEKMIYTALDLYLEDHQTSYPKINGEVYNISLQTLIDEGLIEEDILENSDTFLSNSPIFIKVIDSNYNYSETFTQDFVYKNEGQEFKVPFTGVYKIELWGANSAISQTAFAKGAYTSGTIELNQNQILYVYVGEAGIIQNTTATYNGGGGCMAGTYGTTYNSHAPGGGATDVRLSDGEWNNAQSLNSRIMVAAGAGRSSGGGISSSDSVPGSTSNASWSSYYVIGATQITGGYSTYANDLQGTFGIGGDGEQYNYGYGSHGGGGGYYGGGGNISQDWKQSGNRYNPGGATGGSSFISGHTGCVAIKGLNDRTAKDGCISGTTNNECSIHYSEYKFNNTKMIDGAGYLWTNIKGSQLGLPSKGIDTPNGYAKITFMGIKRM